LCIHAHQNAFLGSPQTFHEMPKVYLFSEDCGETQNWTSYKHGGIVDHCYLAPRMVSSSSSKMDKQRMDFDLNMHDWKHFVLANALVVGGGSFSSLPALMRPSSSSSSSPLPIVIFPCFAIKNGVYQNQFPMHDYVKVYHNQENYSDLKFWEKEGWHLNYFYETTVVEHVGELVLFFFLGGRNNDPLSAVVAIVWIYPSPQDNILIDFVCGLSRIHHGS